MTADEMYKKAVEAKEAGSVIGMVMKFPKWFKRPKGFPRGVLLDDTDPMVNVYRYNPDKIIKWLLSTGHEP